ncbi:hypothetical protein [Streptomyces subrutilus]|uniref:hypothetical protein n=1 Tax=Streptomyces subrutilus TaxID=36818 RepID=UPI002E141244|nr:hypothetical protein OG479_01800 [Streptomyces subrutilus]
MQEINFPEDVRRMLWILIGEMPLEARENLAYNSRELYLRFGRGIRELQDEIQLSISEAATALPKDVADPYVRALSLLTNDGGVNHLNSMVDKLDEIAMGQIDHSMRIQQAKWEIIAEIIALLIELALLAALSVITGGTSVSQMMLARARSRLAVLFVVDRLLRMSHFAPTLTGAIEEALQVLAVRLAQIALNPGDRKPHGIDWQDVGKGAAFGALAGAFGSLLGGAFDFAGKWFKKNVDIFDDFTKKNPFTTKLFDGFNDLGKAFVVGAVSESAAEVLIRGAFDGVWEFKWETFVGSGTSSMFEVTADGALGGGGLWLHKWLFDPEDFTDLNRVDPPDGPGPRGPGDFEGPPRSGPVPVPVPPPAPVPVPVPPALRSVSVGEDGPFTGPPPLPTPPPLRPPYPVAPAPLLTNGALPPPAATGPTGPDPRPSGPNPLLRTPDPLPRVGAPDPTGAVPGPPLGLPPSSDPSRVPPPDLSTNLPSGLTPDVPVGPSTAPPSPSPVTGGRAGDPAARWSPAPDEPTGTPDAPDVFGGLTGDTGPATTTPPPGTTAPGTGGRPLPVGAGPGGGQDGQARTAFPDPDAVVDTDTDTTSDTGGTSDTEARPVGPEPSGHDAAGSPPVVEGQGQAPPAPAPAADAAVPRPTTSGGTPEPLTRVRDSSADTSAAPADDSADRDTARPPAAAPDTTAGPVRHGGPAPLTGTPAWEAARAAAAPVTRTHTWTAETGPASGDPARPGEGGRAPVRSTFDVRRVEHEGQGVTDVTVRIATGTDGLPGDAWHHVRSGAEAYFNAPGHRLPGGDLLHVTVEQVAEAAHPDGVTITPVGRDLPMTATQWWSDADPADYAVRIAQQLGLPPEAPGRPAPAGLTGGRLAQLAARLGDPGATPPAEAAPDSAPAKVTTVGGPAPADPHTPAPPEPRTTTGTGTGTVEGPATGQPVTAPPATASGTSAPQPAPGADPAGPDAEEPAQVPVRLAQWRHRRPSAPAAPLHLDWFDPAADPLDGRRAPGTLHGRTTLVRAHVRRVQADDGRWVRNVGLRLPVRFGPGFDPAELPAFQERLRALLAVHANHGLRLPGSGDHLHLDLALTHAPEHAEAVELSRADAPGPSDQLHIRLGGDPGHDDAVALHEILHYAGMRDRGRDPDALFRRLAAATSGVMAGADGLPATGAVTEADLRTLESALDSGPVVRDHPLTAEVPAPAAPAADATPADPLPPDEHDDRWESSRAPRDWSAPLSAYATGYGTGYDGTVGLVHVEPLSDTVVDGLHRQILTALGIPAGAPQDHPVRVQLRERANAVELARQLPYLRSTGRRFTVTHRGREHTVDVRLGLRDPVRSPRYGEHSVEDPEGRVERRGQGGSESSVSQNAGNARTVPVTWSGSFTIGREGVVSRIDAALAATLTHNQFSTSTTVTSAVQTMTAQRSNELSQPVEFVSDWQIRLDRPAPAVPEGANGDPDGSWGEGERHGPVTVWFPQHLAVEPSGPMPAPAALDDLPVWGVDTVQQPARLLTEVRDAFEDDLSDLSDASAEELEAFLSEPVLRGTLPLQRGGGLYSPVLLDSHGKAIGVFRLTAVVEPDPAPTHRSIDGKINLEAHVSQTVKVDSSVKYASGIGFDGSLAPVFTSDTAKGHPAASSRAQGNITFKGGGRWQTNTALSSGGSATLAHAVRSNRSHLLTPARVTYRVTLVHARGGSRTHRAGPWDGGLRMRMLAQADALGREHAPGTGPRQLPDELENLDGLGLSAAPLAVTGAEPMFRRAEAWLREEGFLPPLQRPRAPYVEDEERAQAQLTNLRRFEQARSDVGLRASADALLDGGAPLWLDLPSRTGGTRRIQLRLSATRDTAAPTRHRRTLPGIQVMGISSFGVPGTESKGRSHGWQLGFGGGPSGPVGDPKWTIGGSLDYTYGRQGADTLTAGSGNNQDQFFIGSGQDTEVFEVPALLSLDLYEDGPRPKQRFADPGAPSGTRPRPADEERPPVHTVPGRLTLAVPHHRTQPAGTARPAPAAARRVRAVNPADRARLALTDAAGNPVPHVVRLPDDAIVEHLAGSAALIDAFDRIVTGTYPGHPGKGRAHTAWDATTGVVSDLANRAGGISDNLDGADPTDESTPFREALRTGLGIGNLLGRAHQIFKGGYVLEGLTLPGLGADHEFSVELQGYLHDPEHANSATQYLETDVGATDTTAHQTGTSTAHQGAGAFTAAQRPAPAPNTAEQASKGGTGNERRGGPGNERRAAEKAKPEPEATTLFNPSGRQAHTRRTDHGKTVTSSTGVTRTPTEGGVQHRIGSGATILITVRHGRRSLAGNALGITGSRPVTLAVEIPRGSQFLMSDTQLGRDAEWFGGIGSLTPTARPAADLPLPDRFARTGEPGLAGILSVRQFAPAPPAAVQNGTGRNGAGHNQSAPPAAGSPPATSQPAAAPAQAQTGQHPPAPVERRDALRTELTRLVEREAPGSTDPGHAAYLSGVRTRIADLTTSTALRALPARGPGHPQRFHFLHVAKGGARLVEVSLQARPRQDTAGLRTVRGRRAGAGAGQEQVHIHAASNTSVSATTSRQNASTFTPNARYTRPADDTRTDRTGPALTYTTSSSDAVRNSATEEDRYWMRTDNAADFEVEYEYTASVRSELVTEWPLNIPGGIVEAGVIGWSDEDTGWIEWARRTLFGRPERTATVPALVTLRFTGSEATDPPVPVDPLPPSVSAVDPRTATAPATAPAGGRRIGDGQRIVPGGPAPVFHFNAYRELAQALTEVAPGLAPGLASTSLSQSAEAAAVRIGELIQARTIGVDLPRATGITSTMPGAYPSEEDPDAPPGLRIEIRNPRRITDAGDVTLDRLRLPGTTASTALAVGGASSTTLQTAHTADPLDSSHLFGVGVPVLAQQPLTQGAGSTVTASRREWFKTGGTALPADGGRGTRSYETVVDVLIAVNGPGGTRYVTGSAEMRLAERDVLGHGITPARTDPQVYDLRSMLAGQPAADLRDWTRHPLGDLPAVLAGALAPNEDAAQIWLATGPDADGSRLGRALYAASRTAVLAGRPVELVLRTDDGLQHWEFAANGSLAGTDAATVTAWNALADTVTAHSDARRAQLAAGRQETGRHALRPDAVTDLAAADTALATARTDLLHEGRMLRDATKARTRARTALSNGRTAGARARGRIRRLEKDTAAVERRLAAAAPGERALSVEARTAAAELRHMTRGTGTPPPVSAAAVQAREQRARAALARIQGLRGRLDRLRTDLAAARADARTAEGRLPALEGAVRAARTAEGDRRKDLRTATRHRDRAAGLRHRSHRRLTAIDAAVEAARHEQTRQAGLQTEAARRLPGLARTLGATRRITGGGPVRPASSSVTSIPARGPRTALAARSTTTPGPSPVPAASTKTTGTTGGTGGKDVGKGVGKTSVKTGAKGGAKTGVTAGMTTGVKTGPKTVPPPQPKGTVGGSHSGAVTVGTGTGTGPGTGTVGGVVPGTVSTDGGPSRRPPAGAPLRTVANGECLLYAFLASAPQVVRDRLPGLAANDPEAFTWLSDTTGVRTDLSAQATALSYNGTLPGHRPSRAAVTALRTLVEDYLLHAAAGQPLPDQVLLQLRASTAGPFARLLRAPTTTRADLTALARAHGVANPALLNDAALRTALENAYWSSIAPPSTAELQGMLGAVRTWETSWAGDHGDVFLMLTAHALGVGVDVAQWDLDGNPPVVPDRYGPAGGPVVEVHYSPRLRHYQGSTALPAPAPAVGPVVTPVPPFAPVPTRTAGEALTALARSAGAQGVDTDDALRAALASPDVVRLLDRARPVPLPELTRAGVVPTAGQTAQAVLLGRASTVDELGLTPLQHLRWLLDGARDTKALVAVWEAVARSLGVEPGTAPLNQDGTAYVVTGGTP